MHLSSQLCKMRERLFRAGSRLWCQNGSRWPWSWYPTRFLEPADSTIRAFLLHLVRFRLSTEATGPTFSEHLRLRARQKINTETSSRPFSGSPRQDELTNITHRANKQQLFPRQLEPTSKMDSFKMYYQGNTTKKVPATHLVGI